MSWLRKAKYSDRYELQLLDEELIESASNEASLSFIKQSIDVESPPKRISFAESDHPELDKFDLLVPSYYQEMRYIEDKMMRKNAKQFMNQEKRIIASTNIILAIALNPGTPPPNIKPRSLNHPDIEAGIDMRASSAEKSLNYVCDNLRVAFGAFQPKARITHCIRPSVADFEKACQRARQSSGTERIVLYYNGHGVPMPTISGDIYLFDAHHLNYVPLSIERIQTWLDAPCAYIWDVAGAGRCIKNFSEFATKHFQLWEQRFFTHKENFQELYTEVTSNMTINQEAERYNFAKPPNFENCIHYGACAADEFLPTDPKLPADLFTYCLTKPVLAFFEYYLLVNDKRKEFPSNIELVITGNANDQQSLHGQLSWILQSITDSIAWSTLSRDLFQHLYRNDSMISSLSRNFLVAEIVMRAFECNVQSLPALPRMSDHPLWGAFERCLDGVIAQYDNLSLANQLKDTTVIYGHQIFPKALRGEDVIAVTEMVTDEVNWLISTEFFTQQANTFSNWLDTCTRKDRPPEQFPILLHMILYPKFRDRAFELIARFVELGDSAIQPLIDIGLPKYIAILISDFQRSLTTRSKICDPFSPSPEKVTTIDCNGDNNLPGQGGK